MHLPEKLSNEHYQRLYRFQDEILAFIERWGEVFYLSGGTALSRALELEKVRWTTPIQVEDFERDRDIMVRDIITKETNRLFKIRNAGRYSNKRETA